MFTIFTKTDFYFMNLKMRVCLIATHTIIYVMPIRAPKRFIYVNYKFILIMDVNKINILNTYFTLKSI